MKNAKKWIISVIVALGVALSIIGLFVAYVKSTSVLLGQTSTSTITLFENSFFNEYSDLSRSVMAFAIITVAFASLTLILNVLQYFNIVKDNKIKMLISALSIICAIVAFVLVCVFANEASGSIAGLVGAKSAPAIGAYLLAIGGIVAGLFGFVPVNKKKR